jgi:hypothetical protein
MPAAITLGIENLNAIPQFNKRVAWRIHVVGGVKPNRANRGTVAYAGAYGVGKKSKITQPSGCFLGT